jgi:hypothetical protein
LIVLGVVAALGLGALGVATFHGETSEIDWDSQVPTEQKLKWVETRLARGEDVDLVPANQNPRWYQLFSRSGTPVRFPGPGRPIVLSGTETTPAVLELCRDPQSDNFRFDVVLRQTETSRAAGCKVGLYCARRAVRNPLHENSWIRMQWEVGFNDQDDREVGGTVISHVWSLREMPLPARQQINRLMLDPTLVRYAPTGDPNRKVRRTLGVELRGETARLFFEGRLIGTFPVAALDDEMRRATRETGLAAAPESLFRRGGLGVYAYSATAEIIECRLTPINLEQ